MIKHKYFSQFCRSIGHPARLAILDAIVEHNNCIEESSLLVPSISHSAFMTHVKALKRTGLIKGTMVKTKQCYCVDWEKMEAFKNVFDDFYFRVNDYKNKVLTNEGKCVKE